MGFCGNLHYFNSIVYCFLVNSELILEILHYSKRILFFRVDYLFIIKQIQSLNY